MHKIVYLAVKKGSILVNILLLKIFMVNNFHINTAVYLLNNFCELSGSRYSARVMPKMCVCGGGGVPEK